VNTHPTTPIRRDRPPRRVLTAALCVAITAIAAACGDAGAAEPSGPTIPPDPEAIITASAEAMGEVTSVEFRLERDGASVYIDAFESIALNTAVGQFTVPRSAQAVLEVEVNGSLTTELGAIALDDEIWLSNPVTGEFETLPAGYDLDPSLFFDPEDGWRPLMAGLTDVELVGTVDRDGTRYHVRGTAPAEQVEVITARLVRDQDVEIDFWIQPVTGLVHAAEFSTPVEGGAVEWSLELDRYGDEFDIEPPDGIAADGGDIDVGEVRA
jgi:lipoprotein LprG